MRMANRERVEALCGARIKQQEVLAAADLQVDVVHLVVVRRRERPLGADEELGALHRPEASLHPETLQSAHIRRVDPQGSAEAAAPSLSAGAGRALTERRLQVVAVRAVLARGAQEAGKGGAHLLAANASGAPVGLGIPVGAVAKVVEVAVLLASRAENMHPGPLGGVLLEVLGAPLRNRGQQVQPRHDHRLAPLDAVHRTAEAARIAAVNARQLRARQPGLVSQTAVRSSALVQRAPLAVMDARPGRALTLSVRLEGQQAPTTLHCMLWEGRRLQQGRVNGFRQ
mmetsp:Transcript_41141/g.111225  ORF Transcript_41141/g.111225 Transcript_41141/m.111225 type:complete len:285 (-) Transcript_41141:207-1061(-)